MAMRPITGGGARGFNQVRPGPRRPASSDAQSTYRKGTARSNWMTAAKWSAASLLTQTACTGGDAALYVGAASVVVGSLFFGYLKYFEKYTLYGRFTVSKTKQELYGNFAALIEAGRWRHVKKVHGMTVRAFKKDPQTAQYIHAALAERAHIVPTSHLGMWGRLGVATIGNNMPIFEELLRREAWGTIEGEWGEVETTVQHARDNFSRDACSAYSDALVRFDHEQPGSIPDHVLRMAACMNQNIDSMVGAYTVLLLRGADEEAAAVRLHANQKWTPEAQQALRLPYACDIRLFERAVRKKDWNTVGHAFACVTDPFHFPVDEMKDVVARYADTTMPTEIFIAAATVYHGSIFDRKSFVGLLVDHGKRDAVERILGVESLDPKMRRGVLKEIASYPSIIEAYVRERNWRVVGGALAQVPSYSPHRAVLMGVIASHADEDMPTEVLVAAASLNGHDERLGFFGKLITEANWNPLRRIIGSNTAELGNYISWSLRDALENNPSAVPADILALTIRMKREETSGYELNGLLDHLQRRGAWQEVKGIFEQPGEHLTIEARSHLKRHVALWADNFGVPDDVLVAAAKMPSDMESTARVFEVLGMRGAHGRMQEVLDYAREHFDEATNAELLRVSRQYSARTSSNDGYSRDSGGYRSGGHGGFGGYDDFFRNLFGNAFRDISGLAGRARAKSHYDVLGVGRDATPDQVKRAYRKLAVLNHPDRVDQDDEAALKAAAQKFQEISDAYEVLSDSEKRQMYDLLGFLP